MFKWIRRIIFIILLLLILVFGFFIYNGHAMYKDALSEISLKDKIEKIQNDKNYVKI